MSIRILGCLLCLAFVFGCGDSSAPENEVAQTKSELIIRPPPPGGGGPIFAVGDGGICCSNPTPTCVCVP